MISIDVDVSDEQKEILSTLLEFGLEHWTALSQRYGERTGEVLPASVYDQLKEEIDACV